MVQDILIIGCGPVGLFCIANAKALGAKQIITADLFDEKLEVSK